jgi:hypothetical protein
LARAVACSAAAFALFRKLNFVLLYSRPGDSARFWSSPRVLRAVRSVSFRKVEAIKVH